MIQYDNQAIITNTDVKVGWLEIQQQLNLDIGNRGKWNE